PRLLGRHPLPRYRADLPNAQGVLRGQHPRATAADLPRRRTPPGREWLSGIPDEDVARVKAGAESRLLLMWGRPNEDAQIRLARGMAAFWRYAESLVASRAEQPHDDFTSDLLLARDVDLPALNHQEVT